MGFVEASSPNVEFAFEAEGEAALDKLHRLFERDFGGRGEDGVNVVGHDDEDVKLVAPLVAIVGNRLEEEVGVGFDLEETAAVGGYGGDKVGAEFLGRAEHLSRVKDGPGAKALLFDPRFRGLKAPTPSVSPFRAM